MLETDPSTDLPVSEELMIASRRSVLRPVAYDVYKGGLTHRSMNVRLCRCPISEQAPVVHRDLITLAASTGANAPVGVAVSDGRCWR